jgi:hypothetical protein
MVAVTPETAPPAVAVAVGFGGPGLVRGVAGAVVPVVAVPGAAVPLPQPASTPEMSTMLAARRTTP